MFVKFEYSSKCKYLFYLIKLVRMGLSKRDLTRKKKSIESKIEELEERARRNPKDKNVQNEINDLKKKLYK